MQFWKFCSNCEKKNSTRLKLPTISIYCYSKNVDKVAVKLKVQAHTALGVGIKEDNDIR